MELLVTLIRSGLTSGGCEGRQLGLMDEALCEKGRDELIRRMEESVYPEVEIVYSSSLLRCRGTTEILYPHMLAVVTRELCAFDLGGFSGMTYSELITQPEFLAWVGADGLAPCPNGENPYGFSARCARAFRGVIEEMSSKGIASAAMVTHDTVIGAIMQRFCLPRSIYRNWSVPHGGSYTISYNTVVEAAKKITCI